MEVNSFLTGKRGVSLPFTDYCDPIIDGGVSFLDLFYKIIEFGKKLNWKYIELRGAPKPPPQSSVLAPHSLPRHPQPVTRNGSFVPFVTYLGHSLDLTRGEEEIFSSLRDSTRRNIKKAMAQGVEVKISRDSEAIKEFYRLNCMTRKQHGLPPQPNHFFQKVYDHIISKGLGFVTLASHKDKNIAGAIFFHFGDNAIYKYGASDKIFQDLRANNLVMWEGIKWFCKHGDKSLCFGRTELEHTGLRQFKTGWGTEKYTLSYFKYDLRRMEFATTQNRINAFGTRLFQRMPIPVLNLAGSILYRHMG